MSAVLSVSGLLMQIAPISRVVQVIAVAIAFSAVVAGFEWNAGLKATAANHLVVGVLMLAEFVAFGAF